MFNIKDPNKPSFDIAGNMLFIIFDYHITRYQFDIVNKETKKMLFHGLDTRCWTQKLEYNVEEYLTENPQLQFTNLSDTRHKFYYTWDIPGKPLMKPLNEKEKDYVVDVVREYAQPNFDQQVLFSPDM